MLNFHVRYTWTDPGIQSRVGTFRFQTLINIIQKKKKMPEADIHCLYKQKVTNIRLLQLFTIDFDVLSYFETVA